MVSKLKTETAAFADALIALRSAAMPRELDKNRARILLPVIPYDQPAPSLVLVSATEKEAQSTLLWSTSLCPPRGDTGVSITISAGGLDLLLGDPVEQQRAGVKVSTRSVVFDRPGFYAVKLMTSPQQQPVDSVVRAIARGNPNPDFLDLYSCSPGVIVLPVAVLPDRVLFTAEHTGRNFVEGAGSVWGFSVRFLCDFVDRDIEGNVLLPDTFKARTAGQVDRLLGSSAPGPFDLTDEVALEVGRNNAIAARSDMFAKRTVERWVEEARDAEDVVRAEVLARRSATADTSSRRRVKLTRKMKD
jgi:hypothetical protein